MMKRPLIISLAAAGMLLTAQGAHAQINSPDADGYFARGIGMYQDCNYNGCIDELLQLRHMQLTASQSEQACYYLAMATLHSGDDEALDLLNEFLERFPASRLYQDVTMSIADYHFTRGNYAEALKIYSGISPDALTDDRSEDLLYRQAYSYMLLGENLKARPLFTKLMRTRRYANAARFYLAYMSYSDRDYASALSMFKTVDTSREPGTTAEYYMSQIYFLYEDYDQALTMAKNTMASDEVPQFAPEANRIAGESLYNLGRMDEALPYLWRYAAETQDPQPSAFYILGVNEFNSGNWHEAIKLLQRAVTGDEKLAQSAYLYLGQAYVKTGNHDGALLSFEKAYKLNDDPAITEAAFYNYIVARMDGGRIPFGNTVSMLEDFLRRFPKSKYAAEIQESLINGYMTDNDFEAALASINRMSAPSAAVLKAKQRVLFELGTREFAAGRTEAALSYFKEARTGDNASISRQAQLWSADCNYRLGNYSTAAEQYLAYANSIPESDPNRTLAYFNLGYARYNQGRYADALTDFNRVIDARPAKPMLTDAYNRAADCMYQLRDFTGAAAAYKQAYEADPESGDYALYQTAVMYGLQGRHTDKVKGLDDMISRFPSSALVPAAMLDKAEAYAALGDTEKAVDTYRELVRKYESSPYGRQGYLQLAITYLNGGDREGAIDTYKKVITTYPTSDEARIAVDDLKRIYADDGRLSEFSSFLASIPKAPQLDASELDEAAFQSAENQYVNSGSETALNEYLRQYPNGAYEPQAKFYLAESAAENGNYTRAIEYASDVLKNHPDSEVAEDAMLIKADAEAAAGKGELALESYRILESRASGSRIITDARMGIMRTALELGRYNEALVATDKLKASSAAGSTDMPEITFSEGLALQRLGRGGEARAVWKSIASDVTNQFGAKSAVYLAQSLLDDGHTDEASRSINTFINANTPHQYWLARGFIVLSDVLRKQGKEFEANEYLRSLRANYPGTENEIFQMIDQRLTK
ncbi:MAG: tetratricopeptide repeat protein [Muribaculaceae bacterium]|nr:tetratricopeptide repeat protein [Muribaculaceae bacterium]